MPREVHPLLLQSNKCQGYPGAILPTEALRLPSELALAPLVRRDGTSRLNSAGRTVLPSWLKKRVEEVCWWVTARRLVHWEERKRIINALTTVSEKKQSQGVRSLRGKPVSYFLKVANGQRYQVCKSMFASTLGIPLRTLGFWMSDREKVNRSPSVEEQGQDENRSLEHPEKPTHSSKKLSDSEVAFLKTWLGNVPVVESHYCRQRDTYKDKKN